MTHPFLTDAQYADLYGTPEAPRNPMLVTRWAWEVVSPETRAIILSRQPVVVFDRADLGRDDQGPLSVLVRPE